MKAKTTAKLMLEVNKALSKGKTEAEIMKLIEKEEIVYTEPETEQVVIAKALESCENGEANIKAWLG